CSGNLAPRSSPSTTTDHAYAQSATQCRWLGRNVTLCPVGRACRSHDRRKFARVAKPSVGASRLRVMGPGGFDMQQIFAAAQQALSAQQELANSELTGTAGGGAVRAVVSGVGQLLDVTIDPSVIDPADPAETAATIADLVLAAVRDAWDSAVDLQQRQLGALGGGFGGAPPGVAPS